MLHSVLDPRGRQIELLTRLGNDRLRLDGLWRFDVGRQLFSEIRGDVEFSNEQ